MANKAQRPEVLEGIRMMMSFVPIVLIVIGIIVISFYPISEEMHQEIVRELSRKKAARRS